MALNRSRAYRGGLNSRGGLWFERTSGALKPAFEEEMPEEPECTQPLRNKDRKGPEDEQDADLEMSGAALRAQIADLYYDYYPNIHRYLQSLHLRPEEIEEVIQEVFLRFTSELAKGRRIEKPRGWVIRVAQHLAIHLRKSKARYGVSEAEEERAFAVEHVDPAPSQELRYIEDERMVLLGKALMSLKERDRKCFLLRAEGMSCSEIGAAMKISERRARAIVNNVAVKLAVICG